MAKKKASTSFKEVLDSIKKQPFPVYFLHGEEAYYMDKIVDYAEKTILNESEKAFNLTILYGKDIDYNTVLDAAKRYPLMAEKQVVIVKEAQNLKTLDKLASYFEKPAESTVLVIAHKHKSLDKRKKYAKKLKASPFACVFESKKMYDNKLPGWIQNYVVDNGFTIDGGGSALLAEYLGNDLNKVANELDKLMLNTEKGQKITKKLIQKNVGISKDFNVFELQSALVKKDALRANLIINYFAANPKNHPLPLIMASLYNYFSKLYICKSLQNTNDKTIAEALGINQYFVKDYRNGVATFRKDKLEEIIHLLKVYDLRSKGVENRSVPHSELLKELVFKIMH